MDKHNKSAGDKKSKKALIITSVASMLDNFNRSNIKILQKIGFDVTIAANFHTKEDINSQEKIDRFSEEMKAKGVHIVHIDFSRKVRKVRQQQRSIRQVRKLLTRKFDLIHCHSPICSVIVRAEAQKYRKEYGCNVIYTAHGFHFFRGAPLKNWVVFYPVEKLMSRYMDVLITINQEDFNIARKRLHAVRNVYIPGVGVDRKRFKEARNSRAIKRRDLGVGDNDIMLLSVGELNKNKNHELAIKALSVLRTETDISNIQYFICGQGDLENYLKSLIDELDLRDTVHLLGYRTDVAEMMGAADTFLFLSKREGLPVSLMEAMASGLPCIATRVRGNTDLVEDDVNGFIVGYDEIELKNRITLLSENSIMREKMSEESLRLVRKRDVHIVEKMMQEVYRQ